MIKQLKNFTLRTVLVLIVLIGSSTLFVCAQKKTTAFDSVYMDIATNVKATNLDGAISRADSLFKNSQNNLQKTKSTLLLALFYEYKGELADAIYWATESESLAIADKNHEFQVRASGYLATLYRRIDLTSESNNHILKAEKANAKRKSEPNYPIIQSTIYHEKALHSFEKQKYDQALRELDKSIAYIHELDNYSHLGFALAAINETYVECYLQLEEYEKAREKAEQGLSYNLENYPELISAFNSFLGTIEMHDKNYEKAYEHLEIARELTENLPNLAIQIGVYEALKQYYTETGDVQKALLYGNKVDKVKSKRSAHIKKVSNEILVKMHTSEYEITTENKILIQFIIFLSIIILIALVISRVIINNQKKKYKQLINRLKNSPVSLPINPLINTEVDEEKVEKVKIDLESIETEVNTSSSIMTPETEARLLEKLNLMEQKKFYLKNDITLSALTVELNSNTRYVSYIIKHYKNNDFNNYINELRVFYIVRLMREEPKHLKYKLSYIAEIAGFSSHSKFATMFKKVTDLTPSAFIQEVKKENKENSKAAVG